MVGLPVLEVNAENVWRTETPGGSETWERTPYANAGRRKYYMISADTHISPPPTLIRDRIAAEYKSWVPHMKRDENGTLWTIIKDRPRMRIVESDLTGEDLYRSKSGSSANLEDSSNDLRKRMADLDLDGIDAELVFPNAAALLSFLTTDPHFMQAQFRIYNDWAEEISRPYRDRMNVAACVATGDVDSAVAEVERVAAKGFRVITLPNKPVFNSNEPTDLNYNAPAFDRLWAAVQDTDMTVTFHVGTGGDPRAAKGPGGAVLNFAVYSLTTTAEPVAHVILSGALDRFPRMRVAAVESGIGWVPWLLDTMDEGYRKHHMWAFPKLRHGLPSDYFRANCGATFGEDRAGLLAMEECGLENNFCWANDYPHHEGTFPHSGQAIEREMRRVSEAQRVKLLATNAARLFRFDIPKNT